MLDNPNDAFMFLMPLSLKPDDENIGNSYFKVATKNLTTKEYFTTLISPEIIFTHFKLHKAYKSAKLDKKANKDIKTEKQTHRIDTRLSKDQYDVQLGNCLNEKFIGQLLRYKYKYVEEAKKTSCYLIKFGELINLIIPHFVIAIYYYYRSTVLREATLRCDLNNLYYGYDCNSSDASIIIPKYVPETDAPFIHRFLCQNDAVVRRIVEICIYFSVEVHRTGNPPLLNYLPKLGVRVRLTTRSYCLLNSIYLFFIVFILSRMK